MIAMETLPLGWTEAQWTRLRLAEKTPPNQRTDDDWAILDQPRVWNDDEISAGEIYDLGPAEAVNPVMDEASDPRRLTSGQRLVDIEGEQHLKSD